MDITELITLLGGLALFLYGMSIMSNGLEKLSGGRLESILERMTSNLVKSVLLGAGVTAIIQSSSATTVMVVGFVNAGIMSLTQAVGVIMGANVGTTATALLIGLGALDSSTVKVLSFFKPGMLAPIALVAGIILYTFLRKGRKHDVGQILLGFGILFFGVMTMEGAMTEVSKTPAFADMMATVRNPVVGVAVGTLLTAIIQSSSASIGILQAISASGAITFAIGAPIILGQNIGTCITAILSSIGASRNAKRASLIHLYFNIIGTAFFLALLYGVNAFYKLPFWDAALDKGTIAIFHLLFNIVTTLVLLPFSRQLVRLATATLRGDSDIPEPTAMLDDRFLSSPSVALSRAHDSVIYMANLAKENFRLSCGLRNKYDEKARDIIRQNEQALDKLEVRVNRYLMRMIDRDLTAEENRRHSELLHTLGDVERIGDYSMNLAEAAEERQRQNIIYSDSARFELETLEQAVGRLLEMTFSSYEHADFSEARHIEPLEETIDLMTEFLKSRHISRLRKGKCTAEAGSLFLEMLIHFERIADHCANIALYIIQNKRMAEGNDDFDFHAYTHELHRSNEADYRADLDSFQKLYLSPIKERALLSTPAPETKTDKAAGGEEKR